MTRRNPEQYNWKKLEFDEKLLTKHFTPQSSKQVKFIVVHHMTIIGHGTGSALDACWSTWQRREASAHYGVDGNLVRQFVWDKDYAWATGNFAGNRDGISIEHANSAAGPSWTVGEVTWKTGARLVGHLHHFYKMGRPVKDKTVRKHGSFVATACPGPHLGGAIWGAYVAEAQRVYDSLVSPVPDPEPQPDPEPTGDAYVVKEHDTLWAISAKTKVSVEDLTEWNNIGPSALIHVGQVLRLTAPEVPDPEPTPNRSRTPILFPSRRPRVSRSSNGSPT